MSGIGTPINQAVIKPFETKYIIKVTVWRAGTDKVLQPAWRHRRWSAICSTAVVAAACCRSAR